MNKQLVENIPWADESKLFLYNQRQCVRKEERCYLLQIVNAVLRSALVSLLKASVVFDCIREISAGED